MNKVKLKFIPNLNFTLFIDWIDQQVELFYFLQIKQLHLLVDPIDE